MINWTEEFPGSIFVIDEQGVLLDMNRRAAENIAADGGKSLLGTNSLDCHPQPSRDKLAEMLEKRQPNIYTIEKNGVKKLIYQSPWYENGEFRGFVELSLEIPFEMPHFIRS
jgi:transcriptional regulator with PAS, ATPase and Fis domain